MVNRRSFFAVIPGTVFVLAAACYAQDAGSIRGMVRDLDFDSPLAGASVAIAELEVEAVASEEGNYVFGQVPAGTYTLVFSKDGYSRQVRANISVSPGRMTEVDASLGGEWTDMEEFVVEDLQLDAGTEAALLDIRMESASLMDSVSSDLMSQAGAGDAASGLRLVSGATVQDGKYAVIRGLPDRYVNSQMNAVRLPTADPDKRAVHLDQFPSAVIESIQVTKTFAPDQQGDASGGAVNVVLKGIPAESSLKISAGVGMNTQASGRDDFLTYRGGGVGCWGHRKREPFIEVINSGAVGVSRGDSPVDYNWGVSGGGRYEFDTGVVVGAYGTFFYNRDSSFYDHGIDDKYGVKVDEQTGEVESVQLITSNQTQYYTKLYDVTRGVEEVRWGGMAAFGVEADYDELMVLYLYTRNATDSATLIEDTRGKAAFAYDEDDGPYDPDNPRHPGNMSDQDIAVYQRTETLEYVDRRTETLQFSGRHIIATPKFGVKDWFVWLQPEIDWTASHSYSGLYQPDRRQFASYWLAPSYTPGFPMWGIPEGVSQPEYRMLKPAENFSMGNFQRIWKDVSEESCQLSINATFPFEQWTGDEGYFKFGVFDDNVIRKFNQDSFGNLGVNDANALGLQWNELWSEVFTIDRMKAATVDVDYHGKQDISAVYAMVDMPIASSLNLIGGVRVERTKLQITPDPEQATADPTSTDPLYVARIRRNGYWTYSVVALSPGAANVMIEQEDPLPALGFVWTPWEKVTFRGAYSQTVARPTFKELTPIWQMDYLGGDVFVGNPDLQLSSVKNYDLRMDYTPYPGGLVSLSWFRKDVTDPIEYIQREADFGFTMPVNYPEGQLTGFEFELRQQLGLFHPSLSGLSVGGNATFIESEVTPSVDEVLDMKNRTDVTVGKRDMSHAPDHLYNIFLTYDIEKTGTRLGLFYTVKGDTLQAGPGYGDSPEGTVYVPSLYQTDYATLNFSVAQKLSENWEMKFSAKNLTNPTIRQVYRYDKLDSDIVNKSHRKGLEFSVSVSASF